MSPSDYNSPRANAGVSTQSTQFFSNQEFLQSIDHVWGELFLKECERLPDYYTRIEWRMDMR